MVVIVGAGPAGLYLAYKLKVAGVQNVVIIDPRAGGYVRPGHVINDVFIELENNLHKKIWGSGHGHIKDIERILYDEVCTLKIPIHRYKFIRFNSQTETPGIVVTDEANVRKQLACDYVFDCTGSRRALINQLNDTLEPAPFKLSRVSNKIRVSNHFIAYVYMDADDFKQVERAEFDEHLHHSITAEAYLEGITKLRTLGWSEFAFPRCYGERFGSGKVCLYLEAPEHLPNTSYNDWVQAVLQVRTQNPQISYRQLPPSRHYPHKPRFTAFNVNPLTLNQAAVQIAGLPTVIACGDALCDPVYYLAHGIQSGMIWTNILLECLSISKGLINNFDPKEYQGRLALSLNSHRQEIQEHYHERSEYFKAHLKCAEAIFMRSIDNTEKSDVKHYYLSVLREIQARLKYQEVKEHMEILCNSQKRIDLTVDNLNVTQEQLTELQLQIIQVIENLPDSFGVEHVACQTYLKMVGDGWSDLGSFYFKQCRYINSLSSFKNAFSAYLHPCFNKNLSRERVEALYNIMLCYEHLGMHDELIDLAQHTIRNYDQKSEVITQRQSIMNLLVSIYFSKLHNLSDHEFAEQKVAKMLEISQFIDSYSGLLTQSKRNKILGLLEKAKKVAIKSASTNKENRSPPIREVSVGNKGPYSPQYFKKLQTVNSGPEQTIKRLEHVKAAVSIINI